MFNIGDRVKCINATSKYEGYITELVQGREYIVYDIRQNSCCRSIVLDVGIIYDKEYNIYCGNCGKLTESPKKGDVRWFNSSRFVKVQEKKEYITVQSNIEIEEPILN